MDNRRTKFLAYALAGVVVVWIGNAVLGSLVIGPIQEKWRQNADLDRKIADASSERDSVDIAQRMQRDFTKRSLPPDALDGQRLYKEWVHNLAETIGFDDLEVEAGRREERFIGRTRGRKPLFTSVLVSIDGKTTFDRLSRFLYYFHRLDIPHHVADMTLTSEGNEGNPMLKVKMTVEALSFSKAKSRSRLFPESELKKALSSDDAQIQVTGKTGFPKKGPFHVRIGGDILTVTDHKDTMWKVRPGIDPPPDSDDSDLPDADAGAIVELIPLTKPGKTLADYRRTLFGKGQSPFVLPEPPTVYRPRLRLDNQTIVRGNRLRTRARASDLNPTKGKAKYKLVSGPKGLTLDEKSGDIEWEPKKADESKDYRLEVAVYQGTAKKPVLEETARIRLVDPNEPPTLEVTTTHKGFLGDPISFQAKGMDPEGGRLRFSLDGAPDGAEIDSDGKFTWTPSESLEARDYEFSVVVSDSGRPSEKASELITITLKENAEKYTKLIGILSDAGKREAWMYDISTDTKTVLYEGSQFDLAGVAGFVYVIGQDFIEFQAADGKSYRLALGRFLSKRMKLTAKVKLAAPKEAVTSAKKP